MDILEEYFNAKHKLTPDKKAPNAGFFERAGDLGVDALKGAIGLPESFVGLADIATGGRTGKFLDEELGYRPAEAKETLYGLYSEERQQESRDISRAFDEEGFFSGLAQAAIDPAVAIGGIVESLPQMLAGGKIAGTASKVLPNVSRSVLAGGSEGLLAAGSAAESIRNENEDKLLTTQQQLLAMGSGVGTALFGYAGNKIGNKFGLEDIDLLQGAKKSAAKELAETGTEKVSKSVTRRMLEGILSEGVLEELPQSTQEAIMQNIATGKEWNEGLSEAAGMGLISGGIMGGSMGIKTQVTHKAVLAHKAAVKKIGDEAAAEEQRIIDESAAAVGDGTEAIAVTGDSETLNELDTQAKVVETQAAATQATDQVTSETDAELLRVVADKIVSGERTFTPEELQVQQNNPEALEATLDARRQETMAREDLTPDEKAASVALDADPTIFRKLFAMAKTAKGFTAELVRRFGKGAKKFADRLWGLYKNSKMSDEGGAVVLRQGIAHAIKTDVEMVGEMTNQTTQKFVSILTNAEMEIEDGVPTAERLKTLGEIWKALPDGEIKDDLTSLGKEYKAALDATTAVVETPAAAPVVETPAAVAPVVAPEVELSPEELALEADEAADPTRTDQDVKELHAARAEQLKKEDRPGYEPEFKGTQVVPEGFVRTEEDEGFEGDAPFERRARKDLTEQELIDRDMAAEGVRTEYDRFGYVRDRAMLREKEAGNKVLTFEQMQKIDQKMASDNDKAIDGAEKELNNNPEFVVVTGYKNPETGEFETFMDPKSGEFSVSLADIITSDLHSLGSEIYIEDAINFIKREEARLLGKEDDSGRTKPLKSLSELNGYPESLSELISHVESVRAAEDYEHRTDAEENWEKEEFLRSIRLFLDDKEVTRNSKAIDLLSKRPDSIIDFIESEVHYSWDYSTADLKRIAQAFEDEFNAGITTDFLSFVIDSVKNEEIQRVEPETEEYKEMSDAKLNKILQRHMSRVDVSTKPVLKEFKRREGQRAKGAEQKKIQRQYDRFKESASDKAQINRGTWVAFYRSMAELAGRGIGFQKNKLNVDALVPMVSQKAGGAFAALDKDTQRKLVIEMLQNSFINDGVFQHKFYREDVVEGETTEYSSEAFDAQYQATQLGEIVDTDLVDKSELRPAKQRTLNIREGVTLFEVSYTTETGRKVNATVNADRLETIIDENDKVTFKQLEGTHDVAENWSWASDVEKILDIATNRNLMVTAATMNKMSEEAYTDMINDLYDKVYVEKDIDPQAKRDIDRQLRLISALAAEQQYANNVISDPFYFEKVAKENPELGLNAAELYNEYLKAGGDAMIFNSRVNRQVNPKYSEAQKVMTSTPQTVEDAFQETTFMEKSDSEYEFLGNAHRRVGPQKENADSFDQAKTGKLKNPVAQKFYGLVAKAFGADLIIVSDDHFASRYVGKAADGRPKIVINMKGSNHFAGIFAHELFHHVVNKAAADQYAAFKANLKDMVKPESWEKAVAKEMKERNVSRSIAEEEVMAEMFRSVVTTQAFYDRLSETKPGRTLAGKLITRLVANIGKIPGIINRDKSGWWHKNDQLLNHADMQPMYDLVTSLVTNVRREAPVQHTEERFLGPTGEASVSEIEGYLKTPKNWLTGAWKRVFPVGTKNHRDVMKNLQKLLEDFLQFIKDVKPNAVFADFLADPIQTAIMNKLVFEAGWEVKKTRKQVTDKHKKTFEKMTSAELERVHDVFVRSPQDDAADLEAERAEVQKKIEMIDEKYGAISGVKIDQVPEKYMAVRKEMDSLFMRRDEIDNTIVNGINVGTKDAPNKLGIAKAKELGFEDDVIEAFQDYKKVSMEIYGRLKEVYPDLKFRETHYGQSIRWRRENAPQHDDEFDFVLDPTKSKLKGSEHFLEEKSTENTAKIRERGFKYDSINPGELLLEYIREAEKTIALKNALETAGKTLDKEGKPILRIFENEYDAMKAGYGKSSDAALNVYESLDLNEGYKVIVEGQPYEDAGVVAVFSTEQDANEKADELDGATVVKIELGRIQKTAGYEVIHTESKQVIGTFTKAEDAYDQLMKLQKGGQKFEVKVVQGTAKNAQVAQLYLSKDMARMMNNYLAKDRIRSTKAGEALMNVKNHMTGLEFAFSVFHALTIGQELMASYGAWAVTKSRRGEKKFGMVRALAESKEIVMLAEAAIADPSLLENEAFNKKVDELLGSTGLDIMDIAKQYALVGGRLHQDASLRSSAFKLGESHYRTGELGFKIEDGKVIFTGKRGLKAPADTVKAMGQSIKAVFDSQMKENPDKKVQALAKSLQFGVFQTTSAWLMEEAIPEVKMAMWMREYTLRLETQKGDIESGAVLKEEIAHNVMKFIEDRFGEVNWQNQWMDPTAKTFLQFAFRSFTWFTGSWKALTKAGVDVGKLGWFTVQDVGAKDEDKVNYKLTEKGQWGFAALFTHISTVMLVKALYLAVLAGSGDDEVPTDEDTPLLTELLFPRIDFDDPRARVTIPSYISEGYKIMRHLGVIGDEAEYSKLISGRTSSIIGNSIEALYAGEDWRGVSIRDPEDNAAAQAFDTLSHIFISPPISFSSIAKTYKNKGISPTMGLSVLGITDAPAAAKRSGATNKAFDLSREEFKGTSTTEDEMDVRDDVRRAMYKYSQGDKTEINEMRRNGEISDRQFKNALSKVATINGRKNPLFVPELQRALKRLTIKSAVEVWSHMTAKEKKEHRAQIIKKYRNMMVRKDKSRKEKKEIREAMKEAGIFK